MKEQKDTIIYFLNWCDSSVESEVDINSWDGEECTRDLLQLKICATLRLMDGAELVRLSYIGYKTGTYRTFQSEYFITNSVDEVKKYKGYDQSDR